MGAKGRTWTFALRLIANAVPWLLVFQSLWSIVKDLLFTGSVAGPELFKQVTFMIVFGLFGALVTWRLPARAGKAGFGSDVAWTLRVVVTFGLWMEVVDEAWNIISALWARNAVEATFIVYVIAVALIAIWFNVRWMPRDLHAASR